MNDDRDFERIAVEWLDTGSDSTPPRVLDAVLLAVRSRHRNGSSGFRGGVVPWRCTCGLPPSLRSSLSPVLPLLLCP